jgi:hypothetical protein
VTALYADTDRHEMVLLDVLQAFRIDDTYPSGDGRTIMISNLNPYVLPGLWPTIGPKPHSVYLKLIVGILR